MITTDLRKVVQILLRLFANNAPQPRAIAVENGYTNVEAANDHPSCVRDAEEFELEGLISDDDDDDRHDDTQSSDSLRKS